jgi:TRAP transporter TAXI family solute receptor
MDTRKLPYLVVPGVALAMVLFTLTRIIEPLPPRVITLSTGREGGAYHVFAREYRKVAAADGFSVEIQPGAGSVETLKRLASGQSMAGFVQGGTAEAAPTEGLLSLGSLYYEPVWVFHRKNLPLTSLNDLRGRKIQVGEDGSGIRPLALRLLRDSGVTETNSTLLGLSSDAAATAVVKGQLDAAFFIMAPTVPLVRQLLLSPAVSLWSVRRSIAYTGRYRFLSTVTLGEGSVDLAANIPDRDITLLAATATLVVREDVHPVTVRFLLKTAEAVHSRPGLFEAPNAFPSDALVELPLHEAARRYLRKGPPFLERYLPFWMAVTVERWSLLLLPIVGILLPLIRFLPMIYNAQMRKRVTRWYRVVHEIDHRLAHCTPEEAAAAAGRLRALQQEIGQMTPPSTGFMGELYDLKQHLEWLLSHAEEKATEAKVAAAPVAAAPRAHSPR